VVAAEACGRAEKSSADDMQISWSFVRSMRGRCPAHVGTGDRNWTMMNPVI
jgi:hypothetical protein